MEEGPVAHSYHIEDAARRLIALLAQAGGPMEQAEAQRMLDNKADFAAVVQAAREKAEAAGLILVQSARSLTLAVPAIQRPADQLTPAAQETLAAICYLAPVTKETLDYVRGVNTAVVLNLLLRNNFIERIDEQPPRYAPSAATLAALGVRSVEELPDYARHRRELLTAVGSQPTA